MLSYLSILILFPSYWCPFQKALAFTRILKGSSYVFLGQNNILNLTKVFPICTWKKFENKHSEDLLLFQQQQQNKRKTNHHQQKTTTKE